MRSLRTSIQALQFEIETCHAKKSIQMNSATFAGL